MVFLTLRSAKRSINKVKMGGGLSGYGSSSSYTAGYGTSSYGGSSSLTGGYGGYGTGGNTGGLMGGSSSYGMRGASPSMSSTGYGGSSYGTNNMGASSFGTMGGSGKGTADLVDANPSGVITLDPSIKFNDYGGTTDFYGQVEVVQAFDAAAFVSQILSQPGQSKVLVVDGGGSLNSALFDAEMATNAMRNGWKGVVVHGAIRNSGQLSKTQFGVKALGANPMKGRGMNGQRGVGVTIGSTQIQSGLWLYADQDGIVISQTDVSGGSFGSGASSFGASGGYGASQSTLTGGYGTSSMTGGYGGASSSLSGGYGSSTLTGGYGSASSSLTGGYSSGNTMGGSSSYGGSTLTGGYSSGNTMGGTSSYGGSSSMYGGSNSYGSSSYGSSSPYSYGRSTYSSYSSRKKKHKMFKILLATSIAAIVWIVCLR